MSTDRGSWLMIAVVLATVALILLATLTPLGNWLVNP